VYLQTTFLPKLRERGVSQAEIDQMTIGNPRRVLTIG
jgi:predicted metal-dependent phosphotriesterase family hydrolase